MSDFDPESVPIRPAATVMLIDDRPDLQVFMLQRNAKTVFAGGMWVFPGGAVDHHDDASYYQDISTHRTDEEASSLMGLDQEPPPITWQLSGRLQGSRDVLALH